MPTIRYVARKRFKYGGKIIKPGSVFRPRGGKWDQSVIERYCIIEEVQPRPRRRRRGDNGNQKDGDGGAEAPN